MRLRGVILPACLLTVACGGNSPTPTSPTGVAFTDGPYLLHAGAPASSFDPPCTAIGTTDTTVGVDTDVMLTRESTQWVARSKLPSNGDIELRFVTAVGTTQSQVQGTIRGSGVAIMTGFTAPGVAAANTVSFSGPAANSPASVDGTALAPSQSGLAMVGRISGVITFREGQGAIMCTAAHWSLYK
jgi:hypothetical protein